MRRYSNEVEQLLTPPLGKASYASLKHLHRIARVRAGILMFSPPIYDTLASIKTLQNDRSEASPYWKNRTRQSLCARTIGGRISEAQAAVFQPSWGGLGSKRGTGGDVGYYIRDRDHDHHNSRERTTSKTEVVYGWQHGLSDQTPRVELTIQPVLCCNARIYRRMVMNG